MLGLRIRVFALRVEELFRALGRWRNLICFIFRRVKFDCAEHRQRYATEGTDESTGVTHKLPSFRRLLIHSLVVETRQ
jgi:hypothetical protein